MSKVRIAWIPSVFEPGNRTLLSMEHFEGLTVADVLLCLGDSVDGADGEMVIVRVNGDQRDALDGTLLCVNDFVEVAAAPGAEGVVADFIFKVVLTLIAGAIVRALMPSLPEAEDPDDGPTYGFGGIRPTRVEGRPIQVVYGRIRSGGQVINEFVEQKPRQQNGAVYAAQYSYGEGPIQGIGDRTTDTDVDAPLLTGMPTRLPPTGIQIEGNDASNMDGVEAHVRLGSLEQEPAAGFEFAETQTEIGTELESIVSTTPNHDIAVINISDPVADQDEAWDTFGVSTSLTAADYDAARVTLYFPQGYGFLNGTIMTSNPYRVIVRYIELDGGGSPITTGGNFSDGYVRLPSQTFMLRSRAPFRHDFIVPFYDPDGYAPGSEPFGRHFPVGLGATQPQVASPNLPPTWTEGAAIDELTCECWVAPRDFSSSSSGVDADEAVIFYQTTDPLGANGTGFKFGFRKKSFGLSPSYPVDEWIPVVEFFHNGSTSSAWFENKNPGDDEHGTGYPTFVAEDATKTGDGGDIANQPALGPWGHFAFTYKKEALQGALDRVRIYANGTLLYEAFETIDAEFSVGAMVLGRNPDEASTWQAAYDEPRVFTRELTPAEIYRSYNHGGGQYGEDEDDIVFGWHFNGTGTTDNGYVTEYSNPILLGVSPIVDGRVAVPTTNIRKASHYKLEVMRNTPNVSDYRIVDKSEWESVGAITDGAFSYPGEPVLSVKVLASEQLNSSTPSVTSLIHGRLLPEWDGQSIDTPVFVERYSRNTAWVCSDILTNEWYALGQQIGPFRIDVLSLQAFADFCNEVVGDGRGDFKGCQTDASPDVDGWTDMLYVSTVVDIVTAEVRGGITIEFDEGTYIPNHWEVGGYVRFTDMYDDGQAGVNLDLNYDTNDDFDGFEIYLIQRNTNPARVLVYYDRLDQGDPWGNARLSAALSPTNPKGTVEGAEAQFLYDAVHDETKSAWETLIDVAATARAVPHFNGSTVRFVLNKERDPVAFVGMGNIIPDTFELDYEGKQAHDNALFVEYLDERFDYDRKPVYDEHPSVQATGDLSEVRPGSIFVKGIVRRSQALRHARFILNINMLLTRHGRFEAGPDAISYEVGDIIILSHDLIEWGEGGRIYETATSYTSIKFDREITITATQPLVRVRNPVGGYETHEISTGAGTYAAGTAITLSTSMARLAQKGDLYLFYEDGAEFLAEITSTSLADNMRVAVEWVEYDADIYDDDVGDLPPVRETSGLVRNPAEVADDNDMIVSLAEGAMPNGAQAREPNVDVSWTVSDDERTKMAGFVIWARYNGAAIDDAPFERVAKADASDSTAVVQLRGAEPNTAWTVAVQAVAHSGATRSPELSAQATITVQSIGTLPPTIETFAATFNEDRVTYTWTMPTNAGGVTVEARRGGWELGDLVFSAPPGEKLFGPSSDWSAGRITIKCMDEAGHYGDSFIYELDTSAVDSDATLLDLDATEMSKSWEDYEDGWIDDGDPSAPNAFLTDLQRNADGWLEFAGSALTGYFTTIDTTDGITAINEPRELYIEANALAFQVPAELVEDATWRINDPRASARTGEGFAHARADFTPGVEMVIQVRVTIDGRSSTYSDWREFSPTKVIAAGAQFRLKITRPDDTWDVEVRRFDTNVAAKEPSIYDLTPEQRYLQGILTR